MNKLDTTVLSSSANVAIIDMGDITRDTTTGLDWLDLTITRGRSYNDISSNLGTGQEFDGWRYATDAEVQQLWKNLGLTNGTWSGLSVEYTDYADFTAASELIGNTWREWSSGTPDYDYDFGTTGLTGTFYRPDRVIYAGMTHEAGTEYSQGRSYKYSAGLNFKVEHTGSYLVALSGTAEAPIYNNEPTGALLIQGALEQAKVLTADTSLLDDEDGLGVIHYQWKANGIDIDGATNDQLFLTPDHVGSTISIAASYTDGNGTQEFVSSEAVEVVSVAVLPPDFAELIDDDSNLWDSRIHLGYGEFIEAEEAQLYRAYYGAMGRLPDEGGYNWWLDEIQAGRHTLDSMAEGFIYSDEFKSYADSNEDGSISSEELIHHMYNGVFGRAPDEDGFNWWVGELDSGIKTQPGAFIEMTQSNEYVQLTYQTVSDMLFV
ncbi:DUF4214 domain-containing protein [Marinobacterium stanieri]|uniref:DUF4214 domain-containing protein n=1 Tax=Marinobacterium stanieri TaxID=49186 RepID=UPI003A919E5A